MDPYTYGASTKGWIRDRSSLLVRIRQDEARAYVAQGFTAMKMKIGFFDPRQDIALVGAIREAIGPEGNRMPVPQGPGLGISIDEKVLARYRVA